MKFQSLCYFSLFFILPVGCLVADEVNSLPLGDPQTRLDMRVIQYQEIYDAAADKKISQEELVEQLAEYRVVLLGEDHTNWEQHRKQAELIELLAKRKKVVIGMEFFEIGQQEILDRWVNKEIDEKQLLQESGWFQRVGFNYRLYKPILDVARKHQLPMYGLNIPRQIVRSVSRQGIAGLSEEHRKLFSPLDPHPEHKYLIKRMLGKFAVMAQEQFDNIYTAQCVWDAAMAHYILESLQQHESETMMVVIAGSGHVSFDLGIPLRLKQRSDIASASLVFQEVPSPKKAHPHQFTHTQPHSQAQEESATSKKNHPEDKEKQSDPHFKVSSHQASSSVIISRNLAKFVYATYDSAHEPLPQLGVMIQEENQQVTILSVKPGSVADKTGWQKGDVILSINESSLTSLLDVQVALLQIQWGDHFDWQIRREGQRIGGEGTMER